MRRIYDREKNCTCIKKKKKVKKERKLVRFGSKSDDVKDIYKY